MESFAEALGRTLRRIASKLINVAVNENIMSKLTIYRPKTMFLTSLVCVFAHKVVKNICLLSRFFVGLFAEAVQSFSAGGERRAKS